MCPVSLWFRLGEEGICLVVVFVVKTLSEQILQRKNDNNTSPAVSH